LEDSLEGGALGGADKGAAEKKKRRPPRKTPAKQKAHAKKSPAKKVPIKKAAREVLTAAKSAGRKSLRDMECFGGTVPARYRPMGRVVSVPTTGAFSPL